MTSSSLIILTRPWTARFSVVGFPFVNTPVSDPEESHERSTPPVTPSMWIQSPDFPNLSHFSHQLQVLQKHRETRTDQYCRISVPRSQYSLFQSHSFDYALKPARSFSIFQFAHIFLNRIDLCWIYSNLNILTAYHSPWSANTDTFKSKNSHKCREIHIRNLRFFQWSLSVVYFLLLSDNIIKVKSRIPNLTSSYSTVRSDISQFYSSWFYSLKRSPES